jgi:hypothetical protein
VVFTVGLAMKKPPQGGFFCLILGVANGEKWSSRYNIGSQWLQGDEMVMMSVGQDRHELAGGIYRMAKMTVASLVEHGQIAAEHAPALEAKYIARDFDKVGSLKLPEGMKRLAAQDIPLPEFLQGKFVGASSSSGQAAAKGGIGSAAGPSGAGSGAAKGRASSGAATGGAGAAAATLTPFQAGFKAIKASAPVAAVVFGARFAHTRWKFGSGQITAEEAKIRTAENAAGTIGGLGCTGVGAAIGTMVCPVVGTAIGGVIGGIAGGIGCEMVASKYLRTQ